MKTAWLEPICSGLKVGRTAAGKCLAWLEPYAAVLRVGDSDAKHYDPYHFCSTVRYLSIDEVEIVGRVKDLDDEPGICKEDWEAITKCFREANVKRILFKRVNKAGRTREKWLDL